MLSHNERRSSTVRAVAEEIRVEVVFATPGRQKLVTLTLPKGACVADAISGSALQWAFEAYELASLPVGIWGRLVEHNESLQDGDRVEIYRALTRDPREAMRDLARIQRLGSSS
jgi:putative ubiquitin-RnfH superfamily antitoxin RatB of RatAB toxin-antitoxin module